MSYWLIFLIITIIGFAGAIISQLWTMKAMIDDAEGISVLKRFGLCAFFGLIACIGGVPFLISIIINIVEHFSA